MSGIGLLNEKPLHQSLKEWYAKPGDNFEAVVDEYVIDIVRDDVLLEIQTSSFASIKSKLTKLVRSHEVRLIYPIALEKWIVKSAKKGGREIIRRKSPKRGRIEDLFREMVSFPELLAHHNFSLEILMIKEEVVWRFEGKGRWRRRGWAVEERRLLDVVYQRLFSKPADWLALLPEVPEYFTTSELAQTAGVARALAQKMAYCLRKAGVIALTGKRGRANLYRVTST